MNDQQFKAPPVPPRAPAPVFNSQEPAPEQVYAPQSGNAQPQKTTSTHASAPVDLKQKPVLIFAGLACVIGLILGAVLFGGGSSAPKAQASAGLQGVVRNQDITNQLPRCGRTDRGQACVLYIMNTTRYDKIAEEFFDDAVRLTEVQKYSISMVNPKYAKTRIPPGYFAEIKIPNVR